MSAEMDLKASYYGKLDNRNPVILAFERDINTFKTLVRRVAASTSKHVSYAKGVNILVEIWKKYKHRLPSKLYQDRMLQIAEFLFGIKVYQLALWHGYSLYLQQFNAVKVTDITDVEHFMACFFPEGFDTDQNAFASKIQAMEGCVRCIFELEKRPSVLSPKGLCKLLRLLNFIRIMMQAFQQHEHLCWQIYNGSLLIYTICRYLMTMNCSAQALEYLLWASISLELSIHLMTDEYLPWIVTLYCAVCHCYYDNQAAVQAEEFARRALGKIDELANMEKQSDVTATRETHRAYKEASIKLAAMMFKRAVFETRKRIKPVFRIKIKSSLKEIPHAPWPRTPTERTLMGLFDSSAAQFLGILEALWDSNRRPLQTRAQDEPELQELILELLAAGMSILAGVTTTSGSLSALSLSSSLMDLAIAGENQVSIVSAVRFIKLLFQHRQPEACSELARGMLQVLSGVEGPSFRKAELELTLLDSYNSLLSSQKSCPREDNVIDDRQRSSLLMNDEFIVLVETLHKSVCGSATDVQPDVDLVTDLVIFLWGKVKVVMQMDQINTKTSSLYSEKVDNYDKWLWCLSVLCEVACVYDQATDCIMTAEMIRTLALHLENAAEHSDPTQRPLRVVDFEGLKQSSFSLLERSGTDLLQKVCEVVEKGLEVLSKGVATMLPQDCSAIIDSAFMQKFSPHTLPSPFLSSPTSSEETEEGEEIIKKEAESDIKDYGHTQYLLATDLYLELVITHHRASLKLLQRNAVAESNIWDWIKKNKAYKALFLMQKALLVYNNMESKDSNKTKTLLEEASTLIEKAGLEERKLYFSTISKCPAENKDEGMMEQEESPPPPPILLSRTDRSFTFAPAPYNLDGEVCWYQLCGHAAEKINCKVRIGDCSLPGTGNMVPAVYGGCVLKVDGLQPNQKYVFAVAAYNSQAKLLGNAIGGTTVPLLASMPVPLLSTWAHLAQVALQTQQCAIARKACRELWSHYTYADSGSHSTPDRLASTGLHVQTLRYTSPHLAQLFLSSIFIETEINISKGSLYFDSISGSGPFIWEQEARLAECERMLVAMDVGMWFNDGRSAVQAVVRCFSLLAPLIFHQIPCDPVVQVLRKCLIVLEENSDLLKQNWTRTTSDSLMHMTACITYYLSKASRVLRDHQMASALMECGCRLLQEVYEFKTDHATIKGEMKTNLQLKALHLQNKKKIISEALKTDDDVSCQTTGNDDPTILYDLIFNNTLKDAYQDVMKLRRKAYFTEFAALLLKRTMEEGHPDLVLKWGQSTLEFLSRRDEVLGLSTKSLEGNGQSKRRNVNEPQQQNKQTNTPSHDDTKKKHKQKMAQIVVQRVRANREMQALDNLISVLSSAMQRRKKQLHLRNMCSEERVWKSMLNYSMAQAHLALIYQGLDQLHDGALQHRYSQVDPLCFSLAYSGVLMRKNLQQIQSSKHDLVSDKDSPHAVLKDSVSAPKDRRKREVRPIDYDSEDSCEEGDDSSQTMEQNIVTHKQIAALILESLNKAALHLQRAMVLAHRGYHWTTLQCVCQTVWDQCCRITLLVQIAAQLESPPSITSEQLNTTFTQLLVLATDLIMDMLNKAGLWNLYDSDLTEEELESSLHFSAPLDDSTQVDLRWVRTLVLHTLERLHESGKWESLAHLALVFNSYTRERYALIVTPLIVNAQRKLLERICSSGGPAVPQPHHVKTLKATGTEVNYRSYASTQLLIDWTPHTAQQPPFPKKSALTNSAFELKGAVKNLSLSLVCVPLDIKDTLRCYCEAFEKKPHCLQVFQHSRTLLALLLANTQPYFAPQLQHSHSRRHSLSTSLVNFSPVVKPVPNIQPSDLTVQDYSSPNALYSLPISPEHIPTVTAAYSTSIKYLQANSHDSLRILALHEMGNLQFYNGNTRAAHSSWGKAVDCALQSSGAVEKWDGVSQAADSLQQTLKQAGFWGCLHAAGLTAKIAQFSLTSDHSQRTKCCLLSAHLFKCVLCCSLAQPQADLRYAGHIISRELLPGVDLFSEPHRVHLGTTVTGLNFICHWLFSAGYHIRLLPILALYIHLVGIVCRDLHRSVEGKILKIRTLTELCLFTEAVKETVHLTRGKGILLPYGPYITKDNFLPVKTFYSNRSLLDNVEALEELVNCDISPEVRTLYGATLCLRFNLARMNLVLALTNTIHGTPTPDSVEGEACCSKSCSVNPKQHEQEKQDTEACCLQTEETRVLSLDTEKEKLTPERLKFLLLEGASSLLHSIAQGLTSQSCSEMESLELTMDFNLLKADLCLQQEHPALSSEIAVSSLVLLQTSPVLRRGSIPGSLKRVSELSHTKTTGIERGRPNTNCSGTNSLHVECPRAAESSERIGFSLWLRCRLALVRGLAAHVPGTPALLPGKNIHKEIVRVLQEGLEECRLWGDHDNQALFMVEGAALEAQRGKTDHGIAMLQEAVSLLSGRTCMPPRSTMTLARATLLLSDLRGVQSATLLKLTQTLLKKQLQALGQSMVLKDGKMCFSPPGPSNIYLPYLKILDQTNLRIGQIQDLTSMKSSASAHSTQSIPGQQIHLSSQIEKEAQAPVLSLSNQSTSGPTSP